MGVHSEMIVLLYPVLYSDHLFPIKSMKTRRGPGHFPLLPSSALKIHTQEKTDRRKQHRESVNEKE